MPLALALSCSNGNGDPGGGTGGAATGGSVSTGTGGTSSGQGGSTTATGGTTTSSGGTPGTGGVASTGGTPGTGGAAGNRGGGTGGGSSVAGRSGGGGNASTGGTTGTGGSATGTGGTAAPGKSGLPVPPGASNVPQPSGSPGSVTVLNWAGFKAAASYSFDDDNSSQISAYSQLQALGVPYTFYIWGNRTEASNSVWTQAVKDGHEIGNHTWSHQSTPPGGASDITMDTTFIMQHMNFTPYTMAAPNGASVYTQLANGLFMINRGVADAIIKPNDNSDRFTLPCYIPPTGATASANFNPEIDSAHSAGGWRVILVHGFTGGTDGAYQPVPLAEFITGVKHTISLGDMWIGRVVDVGAYWLGQKAFSAATKTTSGTSTTYTWTLPSNFPPGKYLRVTVPGGSVTQGGAALPWDSHGYYEIALDAKSLTVGP
ncbi:MAG TPA: polysaccharide deacetylase family protein [Polyangia bacterium]|nr:polysaccharide deacetylase family protein [Polyangia bacterium]